MTVKQRRALGSYIREIADMLGLVEWKVVLVAARPEGTNENLAGHCHVTYGHAHAQIWVDPALPTERPDWVRYLVVHELLHIPLQAPWWVWSRPAEDQLATGSYDAIAANAVTVWEDTIDRLARAIGPRFPHIDWKAKPDKDWIGQPDADGDLVLYSRVYHEAGHHRPLS